MNFFLFLIVVLLVFVAIGMLVVFYYVHRGIRFFRRFSNGSISEEEFQRMANRQRTTRTTADGVTIEDRRNPDQAQKKIFADDEGEYVEFTES